LLADKADVIDQLALYDVMEQARLASDDHDVAGLHALRKKMLRALARRHRGPVHLRRHLALGSCFGNALKQNLADRA
jgi:hypothetical protein